MVSVAAVFEDIKVVLIVSSFLLVWFKTDFLYSYLKLAGLKNSNYEEMAESVDLSYVDYLLTLDKGRVWNFCLSLVSCPFCFNFWVCLALTHGRLNDFGYFYLGSLSVFCLMCKLLPND